MIRPDHPSISVRDCAVSRDWYTANLGLEVEFEVPERKRDDADLTLFVYEPEGAGGSASCTLTFQVDHVETMHAQLAARGVTFECAPQRRFWGYGAEHRDPDGYLIYLWDKRFMREKGGTPESP